MSGAKEGSSIRIGMCFGCPWDIGVEATEMAYNYGCLPSIGEATQMAKAENKAWACHSEPHKLCCGYAAQEKADIGKPLLVNGYHNTSHDLDPLPTPKPERAEL